MEQSGHTTEAPAGETVHDDHPCLKCGYSLKGLPRNGVCPECGAGVLGSLSAPQLADAPPGFVNQLQRGALVLEFGAVLCAAALIASAALLAVGSDHAGLLVGLWLTPVGVVAAGWWLMLPRRESRESIGLNRWSVPTVRVCLVLAVLTLISTAVAATVLEHTAGRIWDLAQLLLWVAAVGLLCSAGVGWFASLWFLASLAGRIPRPRIRRCAIGLMLLGPIWAGWVWPLSVHGLAAPVGDALRARGAGEDMVEGVYFVSGFALVGLVYLLLIDRLRAALTQVRSNLPDRGGEPTRERDCPREANPAG